MSDLTPEQSAAALEVEEFLGDRSRRLMTITGFAGTGKTFLLQRLINNDLHPKVVCAAPTGKAASVLMRKLKGVYVRTLHQALYVPRGRNTSKLEGLIKAYESERGEDKRAAIGASIEEEKRRLENEEVRFSVKEEPSISEDNLLIIDEGAMVGEEILEDALATGAKVLVVGDSGQLPPVKGRNWFLERDHDATLRSVQRQALDSPIIRLSQEIREGGFAIANYSEIDGECRVLPKDKVEVEEWIEADQILTGKNLSRYRINRFYRKKLGIKSKDPVEGDKLICVKNDWKRRPNPFINGVVFEAASRASEGVEGMVIDVDYEGGKIYSVDYYPGWTRRNYEPELAIDPPELRRGLMEFDYGYAITVHKSQGSEWDSVLVADDKMQFSNRAFRKRWLYTAVTRASKKLTIVQ